MKKQLLSVALLAVFMTACGNTGKQQSAGNDANDSTATTTENTDSAAEADDEFTSLDHQTFNLHGILVSLEVYKEDGGEEPIGMMSFDGQGRLSEYKIETFDGPDRIEYVYPDAESLQGKPKNQKEADEMGIDYEMKRDAKGRLTRFVQNEFEYDKQGRVCKTTSYGWESFEELTYTQFNDNNDPIKAKLKGGAVEDEWTGTVEFSYEYDDHHNWIKCRKKYIYDNKEMGTNEDVTTRSIEYYR